MEGGSVGGYAKSYEGEIGSQMMFCLGFSSVSGGRPRVGQRTENSWLKAGWPAAKAG